MNTRGWNPPPLRYGATRMEDGGWQARSVLECGGKRSATPPLSRGRAHSPLRAAKTGRLPILPIRRARSDAPYRCGCFVALLCFFLLSAFSFRASGQSYSIDWYKIAGGGGTSTNGQYAVTGTIGQPDAGGAMTGGNYSLTGGFWSLISVVQTTGAPTLHISHSGNTVTIYWQDVSGWSLQQNANLALANNWSASGGVTTSNGTNYLNVISPAGNLFFRLQHP